MEYIILITAITALHRPEATHRVGRSEQGLYTVHNVVFNIKFKIAVSSCAALDNVILQSFYINP